jgi:hypothetical protein
VRKFTSAVRSHGGQLRSLLTISNPKDKTFRNIYFRVTDIERDALPELLSEMEGLGSLLYMVDHRLEERTVF